MTDNQARRLRRIREKEFLEFCSFMEAESVEEQRIRLRRGDVSDSEVKDLLFCMNSLFMQERERNLGFSVSKFNIIETTLNLLTEKLNLAFISKSYCCHIEYGANSETEHFFI
jgi:hypothetical protein